MWTWSRGDPGGQEGSSSGDSEYQDMILQMCPAAEAVMTPRVMKLSLSNRGHTDGVFLLAAPEDHPSCNLSINHNHKRQVSSTTAGSCKCLAGGARHEAGAVYSEAER